LFALVYEYVNSFLAWFFSLLLLVVVMFSFVISQVIGWLRNLGVLCQLRDG